MPEKSGPDTERGFTPAELVRIHEANCAVDYASDEEQNFRIAIMKKIALDLELGECRKLEITGPGKGRQRPQGAA